MVSNFSVYLSHLVSSTDRRTLPTRPYDSYLSSLSARTLGVPSSLDPSPKFLPLSTVPRVRKVVNRSTPTRTPPPAESARGPWSGALGPGVSRSVDRDLLGQLRR